MAENEFKMDIQNILKLDSDFYSRLASFEWVHSLLLHKIISINQNLK